ncbi:MAG: hypothetical protein ACI3XI_01540 [Eubacteriales bacterium]
MKKVLKIFGKTLMFIIIGILLLAILTVVVLNIAKFFIYDEYYAAKTDLCTNPGLNDGFVCQGIAVSEENGVILVCGYMKDKSNSRVYVTDFDSNSYYVELTRNGGEKYTGHAGGMAVVEETVYIANAKKIYSFSLNDVLNAENGGVVDIGSGTAVNTNASFVYADEEFLYVGEYNDGESYNIEGHENETAEGTHYALCTKYAVNDLLTPLASYSIRNYVQGICFTPNGKVVLSTSHGLNDSIYYVYDLDKATDSGKTLDGAPLYYLDVLEKEIHGPAMSEDLDYFEGKIITLTESASNKYIFGKFFGATKIVALDIE